jgi:lipopolysaccharide/colanic/teichoic acid biosynthesis glycosyltransferase
MEEIKTPIVKLPKSKRIFDIIVATTLIIILFPILILIMILIILENILTGELSTPIFYKEIRISEGRRFLMLKFNIFKQKMIEKMNKTGIFIHTKELEKDNFGLTKVGSILKKIYFDELPQLFNVLNGDLSLVGPRPVNLEVYKKLLERGVTTKSAIKAGITGNFQSHKGKTLKTDVELDQEYINFCKNNPAYKILLFDCKILLRTLAVIFEARGI